MRSDIVIQELDIVAQYVYSSAFFRSSSSGSFGKNNVRILGSRLGYACLIFSLLVQTRITQKDCIINLSM